MKLFHILFLLMALPILSWGGNPDDFLTFPPDAASLGLAGATQALVLGGLDFIVNPALSDVNHQTSIALSNVIEYQQYQYGAVGLTIPLRRYGTLGIGLVALWYPELMQYDEGGMELGKFTQYNTGIFFNYSKVLLPFALGINLKYLQKGFSGLASNHYWGRGIGIELGIYYHFRGNLKIALVYRWAYQVSWEEGYIDKIPKSLDIGMAWYPSIFGKRPIGILADIHQGKNQPLKLNVAFQWVLVRFNQNYDKLSVAGGIGQMNLETRGNAIDFYDYFVAEKFYTTGFNLRIGEVNHFNWIISYSYWIHPVLPNRHMITTKFEF